MFAYISSGFFLFSFLLFLISAWSSKYRICSLILRNSSVAHFSNASICLVSIQSTNVLFLIYFLNFLLM